MKPPYAIEADGVLLAVRATPRAKRSVTGGVIEAADGRSALSVRLAAPPVDGAANKALVDYLAELAGVSKSSVRIRSGETARLKMIEISGDPEMIVARLDGAIGRTG